MNNNSGLLKFFGVVSILFGALYAILGSLAFAGTTNGILPGHESQEILLIILAYVIAALALVSGIACFMNKLSLCRAFGLLFAVLGLFSLIYLQITKSSFNIFDCIAMVLGISIFAVARKIE